MTDREKLIARLNASFEMQYSKRGLLTAQHTADDLISYGVAFAKDTNVPSWIPVTERLPEGRKFVLVFTVDKVVGEALYYHDRRFYWTNTDEDVEPLHITHWMPLPEPPK